MQERSAGGPRSASPESSGGWLMEPGQGKRRKKQKRQEEDGDVEVTSGSMTEDRRCDQACAAWHSY